MNRYFAPTVFASLSLLATMVSGEDVLQPPQISPTAREIIEAHTFCNFDGEVIVPITNQNVKIALYDPDDISKQIIRFVQTNVPTRPYEIWSSPDVPNAQAIVVRKPGATLRRILVYNQEWINSSSKPEDQWIKFGVIAHEIGHHFNGDTFEEIIPAARSIMERGADSVAGYLLSQMKSTLPEAQSAITYLVKDNPNSKSKYPKKESRLNSVAQGWYQYESVKTAMVSSMGSQQTKAKQKNEVNQLVLKESPEEKLLVVQDKIVGVGQAGNTYLAGKKMKSDKDEFEWKYTMTPFEDDGSSQEKQYWQDGKKRVWSAYAVNGYLPVGELKKYGKQPQNQKK